MHLYIICFPFIQAIRMTFVVPRKYSTKVDIRVGNFRASEAYSKTPGQPSCKTALLDLNPSCLHDPYKRRPSDTKGKTTSIRFRCRKRLYGRYITAQSLSNSHVFSIKKINMEFYQRGIVLD